MVDGTVEGTLLILVFHIETLMTSDFFFNPQGNEADQDWGLVRPLLFLSKWEKSNCKSGNGKKICIMT